MIHRDNHDLYDRTISPPTSSNQYSGSMISRLQPYNISSMSNTNLANQKNPGSTIIGADKPSISFQQLQSKYSNKKAHQPREHRMHQFEDLKEEEQYQYH